MHQQVNIQQLYALPTLYLFVLHISQKKTGVSAPCNINWLTQHLLVINIKNSATYFSLIEPSSGQIQGVTGGHSASVHTVGSHTVYILY